MKKRALAALSVLLITLSAIVGLAAGPSAAVAGRSAQEADGFSSVTCVSVDDCYAVGFYGDASSNSSASNVLIEHWDGSRWSLSHKGVPIKGYRQHLDAISCPTATSCVALGTIQSTTTETTTEFVEVWNGKRWSRSAVPGLHDGQSADLWNVSCATAAKCEFEGIYTTKSGGFGTLVEGWTAGDFTRQKPPVTSTGTRNELASISCLRDGRCVAVGDGSTSKGAGYSTINTFDGSTWNLVQRYSARNAPYALFGVSCVSFTYCQLVGPSLELRWNGSRVTKEALPKSQEWQNLGSVSCASEEFCRAVGTVVGPEADYPVAEGWDGRTWSVEKAAVPTAEETAFLGDVACAGTVCQAVGSSSTSSNGSPQTLLAERWEDGAWTLEKVPAP